MMIGQFQNSTLFGMFTIGRMMAGVLESTRDWFNTVAKVNMKPP